MPLVYNGTTYVVREALALASGWLSRYKQGEYRRIEGCTGCCQPIPLEHHHLHLSVALHAFSVTMRGTFIDCGELHVPGCT